MPGFMELANRFGLIVAIVIALAWGAWLLRDKWISFLGRRLALGEKEREKEIAFEDASRLRLLNVDDYSRGLVDRLFEMHECSETERRQMVAQVMQQTANTEKLVNTALDTMLQSVDIIRIFGNKVTEALDRNTVSDNELSKVLAANWFVLTKLYGARGGDVQAALHELEDSDE